MGKGLDIRSNHDFEISLKRAGLPAFPTNDVTLETRYKVALQDYRRPASIMFGGLFAEIRIFRDRLSKMLPTKLFIISARYGLIGGDDRIIPYYAQIGSIEELEELDSRTALLYRMTRAANLGRYVIFSFPSYYYECFANRGLFDRIDKNRLLFVIAGKDARSRLGSRPNTRVYARRGVARVGREYQDDIIDAIATHAKIPKDGSESYLPGALELR